MPTKTCDVIIVGGGPGGSTCAWQLRASGMDVLVLDKAAFPRDKICAGWITPPVVKLLELDVDEFARDNVLQAIRGFRCGILGRQTADVDYDSIISYGIRRCEFDSYLLQRSGARIRQARVNSIDRRGRDWIINQEYVAPMLVGAGGNFCPVARLLGVHDNATIRTVVAQEIEFAVATEERDRVKVDAERPELYFCDDLLGYGWCFRKQGYLNVGLGRTDKTNLGSHVDHFCGFLKDTGRVSAELPERFHGHAYRLYDGSVTLPIDDGALLIGDAAGLAYAESGEGIRPAVESGRLAAEAIIQAGGDFQRCQLEPYAQDIRQRFGSQSSRSLIQLLPASWLAGMAARLLATEWFSRRVVMDRWFLRTNETPLS